jgi:hypothetical protein
VLQQIYSVWERSTSLTRREFHEEWLRDEPCDATTTGLKPLFRATGVNSLLETGYMRFEGHTPKRPANFSPPRTAYVVTYVVLPERRHRSFLLQLERA